MKMNRVFLVLGFVLIIALYLDAQPQAVHPEDCCFKFFDGKIPSQNILETKKTSSNCAQEGYIVKIPKHNKLCVREINAN
ncbi:uncharacterized protein LOC128531623 isoform X3 [Clarias gariepinus]|uniref:uncharacterized protein LOC128531623 isoform X3 n=1 Tax=Clarias gariepinus TaxID=13013 RepID=UPI00234E27EC|nr:uncharacterized protein LOC128531623 isoform X3 [Clarias gariepinus]